MDQMATRREQESSPAGGMMRCPMCGGRGQVEQGSGLEQGQMGQQGRQGMMGKMSMMPMGMAFMSIVPALLGFIAGFLVGGTRRR